MVMNDSTYCTEMCSVFIAITTKPVHKDKGYEEGGLYREVVFKSKFIKVQHSIKKAVIAK